MIFLGIVAVLANAVYSTYVYQEYVYDMRDEWAMSPLLFAALSIVAAPVFFVWATATLLGTRK